jgi:hypothetical protein
MIPEVTSSSTSDMESRLCRMRRLFFILFGVCLLLQAATLIWVFAFSDGIFSSISTNNIEIGTAQDSSSIGIYPDRLIFRSHDDSCGMSIRRWADEWTIQISRGSDGRDVADVSINSKGIVFSRPDKGEKYPKLSIELAEDGDLQVLNAERKVVWAARDTK